MQICDYCFNDEEMQLAVRNESAGIGICEACGQESSVVDVDFFSDFFAEVLGLFEPSEDGVDVVSLLQRDWNLFVNDGVGHAIVEYFIGQLGTDYAIDDKVDYTSLIKDNVLLWDETKRKVKEESRFFTSLSSFDDLQLMKYNLTIPIGTQFYRARVIPSDRKELSVEEMGCPPAKITPAGRANPLGIPYLYLCQEEETCYYEVRALYLDRLSIGTFYVTKELKILDFTKKLSLYVAHTMSSNLATDSSTNLAIEISKFKLIQRISIDLSKPLRRFDTELEYVPTQLICEFCKLNEIEGIRFKSSLHDGGVNVVLFDSSSANCVSVKEIEIKQVSISC